MSHKLIDLSPDLLRLRNEGYNVDICNGYLIVRDVPYVNEKREIRHDGVLVAPLNLNGEILNPPENHTIKFAGEYPCDNTGAYITAIKQGEPITAGTKPNEEVLEITLRLKTRFAFSAKPQTVNKNYASYYDKIVAYVAILSGPAALLDQTVTAKTFGVVEPEDFGSPFQYIDTASARADIAMITQKLAVDRVAIVGLGGTGSYVLDLLAKTPVKEIHIFDGGKFSSHNAFRAPGASSKDALHKQQLKVEYFKEIYTRMHKGIMAHPDYVTETNINDLRGMACVFFCVDSGSDKKFIVDKLAEFGTLFIDVGMGLYVKDEKLGGVLQVVSSTPENRQDARSKISFAGGDEVDIYEKNVQVADLNALNAILAVIRWKKFQGFYFDTKQERYSAYTIGGNFLSNDTDDKD